MKKNILAICIFTSVIAFIPISATAQSHKLDCLATDITGPQDGGDLKRCSRVLVPGTEKTINCVNGRLNRAYKKICKHVKTSYTGRKINCLSKGTTGPQDAGDLNACENVKVPNSSRYINCMFQGIDGPQDAADYNLCSNQKR